MAKISIPAAICLLISLALFYFLYSTGKKRFARMVAPLDEKLFRVKSFMPAGFALMALLKYDYRSNFDRKLRQQIAEIHEQEYVEYYLRCYWACAATYIPLGLCLICMFSLTADGDLTMPIFGLLLVGVLIYLNFSELDKKVKERHRKISMELPGFTNQLIILSGAGMTLRSALIKVSKEGSGSSPLYNELRKSILLLEHGKTDEEALDQLVVKCNMPEIRRFVSLLLQNMARGGSDVFIALHDIGQEQWQNRKAAATRFSEEANTKLLFPMMLMLFAVILMCAAPAVMSISM